MYNFFFTKIFKKKNIHFKPTEIHYPSELTVPHISQQY
jgi:hypothetical protein